MFYMNQCPSHSSRYGIDSPLYHLALSDFVSSCHPRVHPPSHFACQPSQSSLQPDRTPKEAYKMVAASPNEAIFGKLMEEIFNLYHTNKPEKKENDEKVEAKPPTDVSPSRPHESPFEVNVNLHGIDPEKIIVEVKEGMLTVEGRKESSDGSSTFVSHQQTLPKTVRSSCLKASLLSDGTLKVCEERNETTTMPIAISDEKSEKESSSKDETETTIIEDQPIEQ